MDLHALATDGVLDVRTAARHGLDAAVVRTMVRQGRLLRLAQGQYTPEVDATGERLHLLRTIAHVRAHGGRAAASHHSGCLVHGLPLVDSDLGVVRLSRTRDDHRRHRRDLVVGPKVADPVRVSRGVITAGLLVVPAAFAIVQQGCVNGPGAALVAADAAVRLGRVTEVALRGALDRLAHHAGIGPVRAALAHVDGRRESPGESLTGLLLVVAGWAATPQAEIVAGGRRYRVDFLLDDVPVVVEFDGAVKYTSRDDLVREKRREDDLRAAGYEVVRITWAELRDPSAVRRRLEAAVARARLRALRPA